MKTLDEVWSWYTETKKLLRLMRRLADRYWEQLPWEGEGGLARDDDFRAQAARPLIVGASIAIEQLDDLAVLLLFSVFEGIVREHVLLEVEQERKSIAHPVLAFAAEESIRAIRQGSFAKVLDSIRRLDHDLVEQVRQVRHYRNWISHGKRGKIPPQVDPHTAFKRLSELLRLFEVRP